MKSKSTIALVLIIVALLVIIFILTSPFQKAEAPIVSTTPKSDNSYDAIAHTFSKDEIETDSVSVHITKPVVSGLSNKIINTTVNDQINKVFGDIKSSFLAETEGIEIFSKETKHQLTVTGSAPFVSTDKLFYVDIEIYSYYSGSAHPLTQRMVLNFVKETGQLVRLEDILKKDAVKSSDSVSQNPDIAFRTALSNISYLAKPKIIEQLTMSIKENDGEGSGADSFEELGAEPKLENYGVFYIHKDKIEWVFGQYQVAPYVFGEIKITIPMNELRSYLAERAYLK